MTPGGPLIIGIDDEITCWWPSILANKQQSIRRDGLYEASQRTKPINNSLIINNA